MANDATNSRLGIFSSTGNSPTLCTAPTAGVTPQKIAAGTATGVTAASIPAHNDRLNEQELMRLTASRARFQTVSERVEQLFSTRRWVTSGELAEITGHYNVADAVTYLRFHGMQLRPVRKLKHSNARLYVRA